MSSWTAVAVISAATAAALLTPAPVRLPRRLRAGGASRVRPMLAVAVFPALALLLVLTVGGDVLVVGLIACAVALGLQRLVTQARRAARAERTADLVLDVCEGMAADLAGGRPPVAALERAAQDWPPLISAAVCARMGDDVPEALRQVSTVQGAGDLRAIAAAWQVSQRSGSGLAAAVGRCATSLRERRTTQRMVSSELASARATAVIMAVLPVGVLAMGNGVGGDPIGFLLHHPVGQGCLGLGAALSLAGLFWLQAIERQVLAA